MNAPGPADLVPGQRYRISFDDCCVQGVIEIATFLRYEPSEDGSIEKATAVFDVARLEPIGWGAWEVEAIPTTGPRH